MNTRVRRLPGFWGATREEINRIKNNDPDLTEFDLDHNDMAHITDSAWELLGGYIADNDYLNTINLVYLQLTDTKMSLLFKNWTRGSTLTTLNLSENNFGVDGVRSMVPLLRSARNLRRLDMDENQNINTECFRLIVESLNGGTIEELRMLNCSIDDITALEHYPLQHLRELTLNFNKITRIQSLENYTHLECLRLRENKIGREGCRSIAKLLDKVGTRLKYLDIDSADMGDEEAETFANSLKFNTVVTSLDLGGENNITEKGFTLFFRLLNDVSSIDNTYNSNHTLTKLSLPRSTDATIKKLKNYIDDSITINERHRGNPHSAGRAKVIATQLNSNKRIEFCRLQGLAYSYDSAVSEIEPLLLPEALALVGKNHDQRELYQILIATVPHLVSIVDRRAVIRQQISANAAQIAALTAKNLKLNTELALIESAESNRTMAAVDNKLGCRKRCREN